MTQKIITIGSTQLTTMQTCLKKYEFAEHLKIIPVEESTSMNKGSLFHKLMEGYYKAKLDKSFDVTTIGKLVESARLDQWNISLPAEEVEDVIRAFQNYTQLYQNDNWDPIAVEAPFTKELYSNDQIRILIESKIDLFIKGSPALIDHKTSAQDREPEPLDNQFMMYAFIDPTESKIIMLNRVFFYKKEPGFRRVILSYTRELLDEWVENTIQTVIDYNDKVELNKPLLRRYSACNAKGKCMYHSLCFSPEGRDWRMKAEYKIRPERNIYEE